VLGKSDSVRVHGGCASGVCTIGRVAHGGIECGPYWPEYPAGWM
jgi:hypothetical protein